MRPVSLAFPERRTARQRQQVRQEVRAAGSSGRCAARRRRCRRARAGRRSSCAARRPAFPPAARRSAPCRCASAVDDSENGCSPRRSARGRSAPATSITARRRPVSAARASRCVRQTGVATSTCERRNSGKRAARRCGRAGPTNSSGGGSLATAPRLEVDQQVLLLDAERQRRLRRQPCGDLARSSSRSRSASIADETRASRRTQRSMPAGDSSRSCRTSMQTCGKPGALRVVIDRVVGGVLAAVRLVVADDQARCRPAARQQAPCVGFVLVPQHAHVPGPDVAAQARRESCARPPATARCTATRSPASIAAMHSW